MQQGGLTPLVFQDFSDFADTPVRSIPTPVIGDPWYVRGAYWGTPTTCRILDGAVVDEHPTRTVTYLGQKLPVIPRRVEIETEWTTLNPEGRVDGQAAVVLCHPIEPDSYLNPWFRDCLHFRFLKGSVHVDRFDAGKFVLNLATAPFAQLPNGHRHRFAVELEGHTVKIWANGELVLESFDPGYSDRAGRYVFWEIYADPGVMRDQVKIRSLGAFSPPPASPAATPSASPGPR